MPSLPKEFTQRIADAHRAFRETLVPVVRRYQTAGLGKDRQPEVRWHEEPIGQMIGGRWHVRHKAQAKDVRAYLLELAAIRQGIEEADLAGVDLPELNANCAALDITGPLILPKELRLCAVDFRHTCFADEVSFENCDFQGYADFHWADFKGEARFDNVCFEAGADFLRTVFCQSAHFMRAMGSDEREVDFSWATFIGYADLEGHINRHFHFDQAKFLGGMDFDG
ncbi:MAG: pentapeptide repeat-containing protein [Rhodocyclaceae bacterium]|nr:pentapeptide repeat-containing protein [Rhodocyclaceae bacterium]